MSTINQLGAFKLARLVRETFELSEVVRRSRLDSDLVKEGYKFSYLVDPDAIEFYAYPDKWLDTVAALPSLQSVEVAQRMSEGIELLGASEEREQSDFGADTESLAATALLTGEFIFGEAFVGQGNRLYVGPEHMAEFLGHVNRIESRFGSALLERARRSPDQFRKLRARLEAEKERFTDSDSTNEEFLRRTRDIVVEELAGISHSELLAPMRLQRLVKKNVLANAQASHAFTNSIIGPPFEVVRWFEKRISRAKMRNRIAPSRDALEADAVTLTQLTKLNEHWRDERTVFVMITRDRGLHSAYLDWVDQSVSDGAKIENLFFALRHPRQYIPILSVRDMKGAYTETDIFESVERAVSTIVDIFARSDEAKLRWRLIGSRGPTVNWLLSRLSAADGKLDGMASMLNSQLDEIANIWMSLVKYAVASKSDVFDELRIAETDYWHEFLSGNPLRVALQTQVTAFEQQFQSLAGSSVLLRHEIWAVDIAARRARSGQGSVDDYGRRLVPSEYRGFSSKPFQGRSLFLLTKELFDDATVGIGLLQQAEPTERLFVSGTLCLDIGAWAAAANLLMAAEAALKWKRLNPNEDGLAREVRFFLCVAYRLSALPRTWQSLYQIADGSLNDLLSNAGTSEFDRARFLSEQLALSLCALAWTADVTGNNNTTAFAHFELALDALGRIHREFDDSKLFSNAESDGWRRIRQQVTLNTLDLYFWARALDFPTQIEFRKFTVMELDRFEKSHEPSENPHQQTYPDMARLYLAIDTEPSVKSRLIRNIEDVLNRDRSRDFAFCLPVVDRLEFQKVLALLGR